METTNFLPGSKVTKFPLFIVIFSFVILAFNLFGLFNFLTNLAGFIPGLSGTMSSLHQAASMLSGRQIGVVSVMLFALYYKDIRVMQLAWVLAVIREVSDLIATVLRGEVGISVVIGVLILIEIVIIVYLQSIVSGKVVKYNPSGQA